MPLLHSLSMSQVQKARQRAEMDHSQGQGMKALHAAELHLNMARAGTRETEWTEL